MEIRLSEIPLPKEANGATVTMEMEAGALSLDFRREDGRIGAYVEFRVEGDRLELTVETGKTRPRHIFVALAKTKGA